jgi:hypothetical protein
MPVSDLILPSYGMTILSQSHPLLVASLVRKSLCLFSISGEQAFLLQGENTRKD